MPKMIQIRNVPDALHRKLKVRAAEADMTLSDYIKEELTRVAEIPTLEEMAVRLKALSRVELDQPAAETIRELREERTQHLMDILDQQR